MFSLKQRILAAWRRAAAPDRRSLLRAGALASVLITEVFGRRSSTQLMDLAWSAFLFGALAIVTLQWGAVPASWWERFKNRWSFETGVDLRGVPELPTALPEVVQRSSLSLTIALALSLTGMGFLPGDLREVGLIVSPTLYFLYFGALVVGCCALGMLAVVVVHFSVLGLIVQRFRLPTWAEWSLLAMHVTWIVGAGLVLPAWAPFSVLILGMALSAGAIFLGPAWELTLIWRARGVLQSPARFSAAHMAWHAAWWVGAGTAVLVLQFLGQQLRNPSAGFELGVSVGLVAAWGGAALLILMGCWQIWGHYLRVTRNPAQASRPCVTLVGSDGTRLGRSIDALEAAGFDVNQGPAPVSPVSVPVRIDGGSGEDSGRWAISATREELQEPSFQQVLIRRSTLRRRRQFLHGMHDLWKRALQLPDEDVDGFWVAPHLWYVPMLFQHEEGQEGGQAEDGIAYHPRLPLGARAEVRRVLQGAEIDLLFVEQGISSRSVRRVFGALFEYHDLFGGRRPADERHFVGIPGVRVLIHDHQLGEPLVDTGHAEPDYGVLARARILHVFRDDGGAEADVLNPKDHKGAPVSGPGAPLVSV